MEYAGLGSSLLPEVGEVVEIHRKKISKEPFPGFTIFGNGKKTKYGGTSMDILEVCSKLNTAEMKLMQFFRDIIEKQKMCNETNPNKVTPTKWEEFNEYLKVAIKKNYAHMYELGIVKRCKRGQYMLNPRLFIPTKGLVDICNEWDEI